MNWKTYLVMIGMAALVATAAAWRIQSWRCQVELADIAATHQADIKIKDETIQAMKDAASHRLQAQQTRQQEQAKRIAAIDAKHYKELRHAQDEATRLRADLASGRRRLYVDTVTASNPASSDPVPGNASTASLDDGADRVELHPAIAGRLVGITGDADECAAKLIGLQKWILAQH